MRVAYRYPIMFPKIRVYKTGKKQHVNIMLQVVSDRIEHHWNWYLNIGEKKKAFGAGNRLCLVVRVGVISRCFCVRVRNSILYGIFDARNASSF